jgi:hypothetical protein
VFDLSRCRTATEIITYPTVAWQSRGRHDHITHNIPLMKTPQTHPHTAGKIGWALLWLLGIPLPVLLVVFMLRGCT